MKTDCRTVPALPFDRPHRLAQRKLSRAHLALSQRSSFVAAHRARLDDLALALSSQLSTQVRAEAQLVPAVFEPPRLSGAAAFAIIDLPQAEGAAVLEVEYPLLGALLGVISGGPVELTPATSLSRAEEAAFGYCVLLGLAALRASASAGDAFCPRLLGMTADRLVAASHVARGPHLAVKIEVSIGDRGGLAWLHFPVRSLSLALLSTPAEPLRVAALPATVLAANLEAHPRVGLAELTLAEVTSLQFGDVVVFDGVGFGGTEFEGEGRLAFPTFDVLGHWSPEGLSVSRVRPRDLCQESFMPLEPMQETRSPIAVELEIELTRVKLPLSELAALKPGALIPLRMSPTEPVVMRVGDRAVARAELVDIEGEVGARILSLLP